MVVRVVLEKGQKWTFATAVDHPGWSRKGKDVDDALSALLAYVPRYVGAVKERITIPKTTAGLTLVAEVPGDSSTDFGAPGKEYLTDEEPVTKAELERQIAILGSCWSAFDAAAAASARRKLATGPRGGGRDIAKMRAHVIEADTAYLYQLGVKFESTSTDPKKTLNHLHTTFIDGLMRRHAGALPDFGPRGGKRWGVRYAIRRSAWHALDHAWEIEDRAL